MEYSQAFLNAIVLLTTPKEKFLSQAPLRKDEIWRPGYRTSEVSNYGRMRDFVGGSNKIDGPKFVKAPTGLTVRTKNFMGSTFMYQSAPRGKKDLYIQLSDIFEEYFPELTYRGNFFSFIGEEWKEVLGEPRLEGFLISNFGRGGHYVDSRVSLRIIPNIPKDRFRKSSTYSSIFPLIYIHGVDEPVVMYDYFPKLFPKEAVDLHMQDIIDRVGSYPGEVWQAVEGTSEDYWASNYWRFISFKVGREKRKRFGASPKITEKTRDGWHCKRNIPGKAKRMFSPTEMKTLFPSRENATGMNILEFAEYVATGQISPHSYTFDGTRERIRKAQVKAHQKHAAVNYKYSVINLETFTTMYYNTLEKIFEEEGIPEIISEKILTGQMSTFRNKAVYYNK